MHDNLAVILLAGGQGQRLGWEIPKQFVRIGGKTILEHSFTALAECLPGVRIVVTVPVDQLEMSRAILEKYPNADVIVGGSSRQGSTLAGLNHLEQFAPRDVMIHDAARPFINHSIIHDVVEALGSFEAVDVAIPATDTIIVENGGFIQSIPERARLMRGQTPQAFRFGKLLSAYRKVGIERLGEFTDDCGLFLAADPFARVRIVQGASDNMKITESLDLVIADEMLRMKTANVDPNIRGIDVKGKTAVIFGGNSGIGKAMTQILWDAGCHTEVASRSSGCDIRHYEHVEKIITDAHAKHGSVDFVINTVGSLVMRDVANQNAEDIAEQISINLSGAFNVARASHATLARSKGMLLNFSSSSYTRGRSGYVPYSSCKAAVVNLTQGLAEEWREDGIRVNCIVPGRTDTAMRRINFYNEDQDSLLSPYEVALTATKVLNATYSGMVVRI